MKVLDIPSSGSVNWRTASRNRNGQYIRNRSIPVQPRSTAQLAVRGMLTLASQAWKSISVDDQTAWKTFGSLHPRTDSLGQSNGSTGQQAFVGVAATSQLLGYPIPAGAPPAEPDMSAFTEGALSSVDGVTTISGYATPTGGQVMIWATKPQSTGRRFFGPPVYLQASTVDGTAPINISAQLSARWGTLPNGSVVQITQIPVVNGIMGSKSTSQVTIDAGPQLAAPVVSTNMTATGGVGVISGTVVTAEVPGGVTYFQWRYRLSSDTPWNTVDPVKFITDNGTMPLTIADSLKSGTYTAAMRWFSGTVSGLPGVWSSNIAGLTVT